MSDESYLTRSLNQANARENKIININKKVVYILTSLVNSNEFEIVISIGANDFSIYINFMHHLNFPNIQAIIKVCETIDNIR